MPLRLSTNSNARMASVVAIDWHDVLNKPLDATGDSLTLSDATLTLGANKSVNINNSLTFAGTDTTTMTFPTTSATIARTDASNTFTGHQTVEGVTSTGATGTGKFVFDTAPTLSTPTLGAATATTINKVTLTQPAAGATLTLVDGTTLTGPAASGTAMTLGNIETVTGAKTFNDGKLILAGSSSGSSTLKASATASGTLTLPAATDTLMGKATTDIMTNKTFDSAGAGNSLSVSGVAVSRGQYPATNTNDSATAGNFAEYIESVITSGSATSLASGTPKTVTSITLTPGEWDAAGNISFTTIAGTSVTGVGAYLSGTTNSADVTPGKYAGSFFGASVPGAATPAYGVPVGPFRLTLSTTTTVFLVAQGFFTTASLTAYGMIRARRPR